MYKQCFIPKEKSRLSIPNIYHFRQAWNSRLVWFFKLMLIHYTYWKKKQKQSSAFLIVFIIWISFYSTMSIFAHRRLQTSRKLNIIPYLFPYIFDKLRCIPNGVFGWIHSDSGGFLGTYTEINALEVICRWMKVSTICMIEWTKLFSPLVNILQS